MKILYITFLALISLNANAVVCSTNQYCAAWVNTCTGSSPAPAGFCGVECTSCINNSTPPTTAPTTAPTPAPVVNPTAINPIPRVVPPPIVERIPTKPDADSVTLSDIPLNSAFDVTVPINNTRRHGALFYVVPTTEEIGCTIPEIQAEIALLGAFQPFGTEFSYYTDTTALVNPKLGLLDKIDSTFPLGSWGLFIQNTNNWLINGVRTAAQKNARYATLAIIKEQINSTMCLRYAGVTEYPEEQMPPEARVDLGAINTRNNFTSFSATVDSLRLHPGYSGTLTTVYNIDSQRNLANSELSYTNRLFWETSMINGKNATINDPAIITHFDKLMPIARLVGDLNWQAHVAIPGFNGTHIDGSGAGIYLSVQEAVLKARATNTPVSGTIIVPSARNVSMSWADYQTDRYASDRGITVVRSISNLNQINDEASAHSPYSLTVGVIVNGKVEGTVGKYGPDLVVDMTKGATTDAKGGLFPQFFSSLLGSMKYVDSSGMYSSQAAEVVGQAMGTIQELCPLAIPTEIYRNMMATAIPITDISATDPAADARNKMVRSGIFNPTSALKQTMLRICPSKITTAWSPVVLGYDWNDTTTLDAKRWVINKECARRSGSVELLNNGMASCRLGDAKLPLTIYTATVWNNVGWATTASGANARFK